MENIPTAKEVISHFHSLDPTADQKKKINKELLKDQYIFVTHGKEAIADHIKFNQKHGRPVESHITTKDRIGHCTHCHHEFVLPKDWRLSIFWDSKKMSVRKMKEEKKKCPICGGMMWVDSAYRSLQHKAIKMYVITFRGSIKDPDVIVGIGHLVVRNIDGGYKTCETLYYPVTLYYFKKGQQAIMYRRDAYYDHNIHRFGKWMNWWRMEGDTGEDGVGSPWGQQKSISTLTTKWWNRGYVAKWDARTFAAVMKKKSFKYSGIEKIIKAQNDEWLDLNESLAFLKTYCRYPHIELLIKNGMINIAMDKIFHQTMCSTEPCVCWRTKNKKKFLRFTLTKQDKLYMKEHGPVGTPAFNALAIAQQEHQCLTLQEADEFQKKKYFYGTDIKKKSIPNIHKLLLYEKKQNKKGKNVVSDYFDYIEECRDLNYDLTDKGIAWPKDFYKAHAATSKLIREKAEEIEREKQRIWDMEEKERKQTYAEKMKKHCKKFKYLCFETNKFFIRLAESPDELIAEGAANHSCVGGYVERYAMGRTLILFIREKEQPNQPFYTMEVDPKRFEIVQCRKKFNDIAPKDSDVEKFIELYQRVVLNPAKTKGAKTA